ncbi:hypothetical protein [Streptomyces clavuligerus]|uniref:hypothetical protein n=1 Tax=Streptomyces clavuligerus TaxID=1901 RepID=UPI00018006FA|nr:hypothetical protein [Streptomyces clavuligerus]EDY53274.1 hypothetical protein SSCG_06302 [Streptomyces clavuligerus]WDN56194.1 hypothetical protein LL058_30550 [Streptomyces clavuligerus]
MIEYTSVSTAFGPVHIQHLDPTHPALALVRYGAAAAMYAVEGDGITGMVAISPAYDDQERGNFDIGAETARALVPTRFHVTFGQHRMARPDRFGRPVKGAPVLTVNGALVQSAGLTVARGGDATDFPVTTWAGDWSSRPASALVAAKTHEVIRAVLRVHEASPSRIEEADRTYTRCRITDRRTSARRELSTARRLHDQIGARIARLESYLTATEADAAEVRR